MSKWLAVIKCQNRIGIHSIVSKKMLKMMKRLTARVACLGLIVMFAGSWGKVLAEVADTLTVREPYFRLMPPGQSVSAAYMELQNHSANAITLVGMRSNAVTGVELHHHSEHNGMMQMRRVETITIDVGETLLLEPGGYHLMLFGMRDGLKHGDTINIELLFASGGSTTVRVSARSLNSTAR